MLAAFMIFLSTGFSLDMERFDCVRTKNVSSLRSARRVFVLSGAAVIAA
jgi:hypothetical protein